MVIEPTASVPELALVVCASAGDEADLERLTASVRSFNGDGLPLFIVVPAADSSRLSRFREDGVTVIEGDPRPALNHLAFWERGLCENYLCIGPTTTFIRPFGRADFMAGPRIPFTFVSERADRRVDPEFFFSRVANQDAIERGIHRAIDVNDRVGPGHAEHMVLSAAVLRSLSDDYAKPRGFGYHDLMGIAPDEFSWYCEWLRQSDVIPYVPREPVFKSYLSTADVLESRVRGVTESDLARGFVGVSVDRRLGSLKDVLAPATRPELVGRYVKTGEIGRAAVERAYRQLPSLQKAVGTVAHWRRPRGHASND